jgi:diguanylate cyclase (GGDEF)-like protein
MNSPSSMTAETHWTRLKRHFCESFSSGFVYRRRLFDGNRLDDLAHTRRRHAYRYILLLLAVILLPIVTQSLYVGQLLPGVAGLLLLGVLMANIWLLSIGREAFLPPGLVLLLCISLLVISVYHGQNYNLYWMYPLLVTLPFLLKTRWAVLLGVLCGLVLAPLVLTHYETATALIIGSSMGLTWLISAWLVFAVTEQSRRLRDMAVTDPLTGAYNRRFLELEADKAIHHWRRNQRPATLLIMDIDHFKRINDRHGHAVGDAALRKAVQVISGRIRGVDTICRFGGEEFVVLLADTDIDAGATVAQELRAIIEGARILPEGKMTVSIGASEVAQATDLDHWLNLADAALYMAKSNGRNRVEIADTSAPPRDVPARNIPDWR